jgi:hypothetical protein
MPAQPPFFDRALIGFDRQPNRSSDWHVMRASLLTITGWKQGIDYAYQRGSGFERKHRQRHYPTGSSTL